MWDTMAEFYEKKQMLMTSQPFVTLCTHARVDQAKRILEVASGPGFHTQLLASTYLQRGGVVVACDFSSKMIEAMKRRFENPDLSESFSAISSNKFKIVPEPVAQQENNLLDIEKLLVEENVRDNDRFIFGC